MKSACSRTLLVALLIMEPSCQPTPSGNPDVATYGMPAKPCTPLVVLLHDSGSDGLGVRSYFQLPDDDSSLPFSFITPLGQVTPDDRYCWNVADGQCPVLPRDDVTYVATETENVINANGLDRQRVYLIGVGTGGALAYRLAYQRSDLFAAIVVFGGVDLDASQPMPMPPSRPVSVLHAHGINDKVKPYGGGMVNGVLLPSVLASVDRWASFDGCQPMGQMLPAINLVSPATANETTPLQFGGCVPGLQVTLWTADIPSHAFMLLPTAFLTYIWPWLSQTVLLGNVCQ